MANDSLLKRYEGAFEEWKARLAIGRIKALGFREQEWPDPMQDMAMVILEFEYDPTNAKEAKEDTALFIAITNRLVDKIRERCRSREQFRRYLERVGLTDDSAYARHLAQWDDDPLLQQDVAMAMEGLSEFDQAVAAELAKGKAKLAIAREMDCRWNTIDKAVGRIRAHFEDMGFDGEGDQPVWPGKWANQRHGAEMIRIDLTAADIDAEDDRGRVVDFHALRHTFISNLARAGVHPRNAQALARHSTIDLTMNVYTHVSMTDLASDVENLPGMGDTPAEPDPAPVPELPNELANILGNWDSLPEHVRAAITTLAGT